MTSGFYFILIIGSFFGAGYAQDSLSIPEPSEYYSKSDNTYRITAAQLQRMSAARLGDALAYLPAAITGSISAMNARCLLQSRAAYTDISDIQIRINGREFRQPQNRWREIYGIPLINIEEIRWEQRGAAVLLDITLKNQAQGAPTPWVDIFWENGPFDLNLFGLGVSRHIGKRAFIYFTADRGIMNNQDFVQEGVIQNLYESTFGKPDSEFIIQGHNPGDTSTVYSAAIAYELPLGTAAFEFYQLQKSFNGFRPYLSLFPDPFYTPSLYTQQDQCREYAFSFENGSSPAGELRLQLVFADEKQAVNPYPAFKQKNNTLILSWKKDLEPFAWRAQFESSARSGEQGALADDIRLDQLLLGSDTRFRGFTGEITGQALRSTRFINEGAVNSRIFGQGYLKLGYKAAGEWIPSPYYLVSAGEKHPVLERLWRDQNAEQVFRNPDLAPSHFLDQQGGVSARWKGLDASAALVSHRERRAPDMVGLSDSVFTFENINDIRSLGVQTELRLNPGARMENILSWSHKNMTWDRGGLNRESFPVTTLGYILRLNRSLVRDRLHTELVWKNFYTTPFPVYSMAAKSLQETRHFWQTDLQLGFRIKAFRLFYGVNNFYNEVIEWAPGNRMPGFMIYWGIRWGLLENMPVKKDEAASSK